MNRFLHKHENLGYLFDWIVLLIGVAIFGEVFSKMSSFSSLNSAVGVLFIEVIALFLFLYVNIFRRDKGESLRDGLESAAIGMTWVTGIILVLHLTVGLWGKNFSHYLPPLWEGQEPLKIFLTELAFFLASGAARLYFWLSSSSKTKDEK